MADEFTDGTDADLGAEPTTYAKEAGATRRRRLPDGTLIWEPIDNKK